MSTKGLTFGGHPGGTTRMVTSIFFDIDGTLVSFHTHDIPETTFEALRKLKAKGIRLFIATGRGKDGLAVLKDFPFDGYITLNGQYCYDTNGKVVSENYLSKDAIKALMDEINKKPFPCGFTMEDGKIFNFRDERVDEIHAITHNDDHPAGDLTGIEDKKVYQCMAFLDEEEEKELLKKLPDCTSARWHRNFADISPKGGTKCLGIDTFLAYYGLSLEDSMAFGDGGNDIQMLSHVGKAVVMGNASDTVKQYGDYITDTVDEDGVAKALAHFDLV